MSTRARSRCPITFALDHIGDRWSLLILRDILFANKKHYDQFASSKEGISTNILASRLKHLEADGLISKHQHDENHRRKVYRPTEKTLDLLPMMVEMILWGGLYDPDTGAPQEVLAAIMRDREKFISGVRGKFSQS